MPLSVKAAGREHPLTGTPGRYQYPWDDLTAGDWFFVPTYREATGKQGRDHAIMGKLAQMTRLRRARGCKHKYMVFRADQDGAAGVKVLRVK